jgi:hypothetical protein
LPFTPVEAQVRRGTYLHHVSRERYRNGRLHFGTDAINRYDDPAGGYGVLYLAWDLATALMESVFHQHRWSRPSAKRAITLSEVRKRMVRIVRVENDLTLCDLASPGAAAIGFGLNAEQLATRRYSRTQALSAQIATLSSASGAPFDGILYPSRNNPGARCVALFDRAASSVAVDDDIRLDEHRDWPAFQNEFKIQILPV